MAVPVQSDGLNGALSPVVYGDIALSINTQCNTILYPCCIFSEPDRDHCPPLL